MDGKMHDEKMEQTSGSEMLEPGVSTLSRTVLWKMDIRHVSFFFFFFFSLFSFFFLLFLLFFPSSLFSLFSFFSFSSFSLLLLLLLFWQVGLARCPC